MTGKKTVFYFETSSDEENVLIISKNLNSRKTVIDDILDENSNTKEKKMNSNYQLSKKTELEINMTDFGNNSFSDQIENSVENQVGEQIEIDSNTNDKDLTEDLINRIQNSSFEESFDFIVEEKRLYYGSNLSTKEASLLIICFFNRFDLSSFAQQKLLELIRMLYPISNDLPKTINKLEKLVNSETGQFKEKKFCDACLVELSTDKKCQNHNCSNNKKLIKQNNSFTYLDIQSRLTRLIRNNINNINSNRCFKDLTDGEHYSDVKKSNQLNIMVYTDGMAVSKSNSKHFWPIIIGLCELPLSLRDSIKNKLVYGIWFRSKKPTSYILCSKLIEEIETINSNGIKFNRNFRAYNFSIKIYGILCDTPAKSMVLNMNQFNAYFGCAYCLNPGDYKNIYKKMTYSQKNYPLRSKETFEFDSQIDTEKLPENGIKGIIAISKKLHLPDSIPIDYMHLVCFGIFKSILNNWFDSSNHKEDFYIGKQSIKKKLESELKKFIFPHTTNRLNFDFKSVKTWKANEYRTFFLYICLPLLKNILKPKFYWNIACLIYELSNCYTNALMNPVYLKLKNY
ncbi:hypothetical protein BpHYR1_004370 [Brachionus plicatilis]|uniref:Uncharacterized protein n=1 Tax=Brachionus plicatilis TaxID=10195 RepID=A0A3M7Q4B8_BRAPC|nr:hypothetical protein BpHYR1_004370 [Brachionus plicatilis]